MPALPRTPRLERILAEAEALAVRHGHDFLGVEHVVATALDDARAVPTQVLARHVDIGVVWAQFDDLLTSEAWRTRSTGSGPVE